MLMMLFVFKENNRCSLFYYFSFFLVKVKRIPFHVQILDYSDFLRSPTVFLRVGLSWDGFSDWFGNKFGFYTAVYILCCFVFLFSWYHQIINLSGLIPIQMVLVTDQMHLHLVRDDFFNWKHFCFRQFFWIVKTIYSWFVGVNRCYGFIEVESVISVKDFGVLLLFMMYDIPDISLVMWLCIKSKKYFGVLVGEYEILENQIYGETTNRWKRRC